MQIPRTGSHVFGLYHYSKKHPNGNNQNRQHSNLTNTKKDKNFAKKIRFIKIYQNMIPKYTEWISSKTDFFQKKIE